MSTIASRSALYIRKVTVKLVTPQRLELDMSITAGNAI